MKSDVPVIICADDDPRILRLYTAILGQEGYDVRVLEDGVGVVELFAETSASLVILDVDMPELNGLDVCQAIRRHSRGYSVPILIVSANQGDSDISDGLSMGANEYIVKPIKAEELIHKVAHLLSLGVHPELELGSRFAGRYQVVATTSHSVGDYLAEDRKVEPPRKVTLEVFQLGAAAHGDSQHVAQFLRQAYRRSKLSHGHLADLLDFGQTGGGHYLVSEHIGGRSLSEIIDAGGPSRQELVRALADLGAALAYLAEQQLIHTDIRPARICVQDDGQVVLAGAGLLRHPSQIAGLAFWAPEYREREQEDERSLLYSLAMSLSAAWLAESAAAVTTTATELAKLEADALLSRLATTDGLGPLLADMLCAAPEDRCSARDVVDRIQDLE